MRSNDGGGIGRVRKVGTNGIITAAAGNGTFGFSGDAGPAVDAALQYPYSLTVDGLCNLFVPHTTASIIISENWDPDVTSDMLRQFDRIVPREAGYKHSEGNSQAHILSVMLSTSINVPVHDGKLAIGRWQGVMLAEFDGPRERSVYVSIIPCGSSN